MWTIFLFCVCAVITPKYGKGDGIIDVMAKTLYAYWSGQPCLVGVAGPNVAGVLIIKAEKCIQINITCVVTINDDAPYLIFLNM